MREIKFRAWDEANKEMFKVRTLQWDCLIQVVINEPIMQYTGMKDRNGKDIYEGDICRWPIFPDGEEAKYFKDVVAFSNGCFKLHKRAELLGPRIGLEIMGNIHENPELLDPMPTNHRAARGVRG